MTPSGTDGRGVSALEIGARWSLDRQTIRRPTRQSSITVLRTEWGSVDPLLHDGTGSFAA